MGEGHTSHVPAFLREAAEPFAAGLPGRAAAGDGAGAR